MPRFVKQPASKKSFPFQREVPPPSPSAGTPKPTDPWGVRQVLGPAVLGNVEGGFGTIQTYAKQLDEMRADPKFKEELKKVLYDLQTKGPVMDKKEGWGFLNDNIRIPQLASKVSSFLNRVPIRPAAGLESYASSKGLSPNVSGQEEGGLASLVAINQLENIIAGRGKKGDVAQVAMLSPTLAGGVLKAAKYAVPIALGAGLMHEPTAQKILGAGSSLSKLPTTLVKALITESKKQRSENPVTLKSLFNKPLLP